MTENANTELRRFFAGYFHQDWDLAAPNWEGVIDVFLEENPGTDTGARIARLIDNFLASTQQETELELDRALGEELSCEYLPSGDGVSTRTWLQHVSDRLKSGSRR